MHIYVAVNEDYDVWVAESKAAIIRVLEAAHGGYYTSQTPTHYSTLHAEAVRECIGWTLEWDDKIGDPFKVFVQRHEVHE